MQSCPKSWCQVPMLPAVQSHHSVPQRQNRLNLEASVVTKRNQVKFTGNLQTWQFFVTFLGWLSDLQLGDEKVTKNHLENCFSPIFPDGFLCFRIGFLKCLVKIYNHSFSGVNSLFFFRRVICIFCIVPC